MTKEELKMYAVYSQIVAMKAQAVELKIVLSDLDCEAKARHVPEHIHKKIVELKNNIHAAECYLADNMNIIENNFTEE